MNFTSSDIFSPALGDIALQASSELVHEDRAEQGFV